MITSQDQRALEAMLLGKRCQICEAVQGQLRVGYRGGVFLVLCGCPGPTLEENLVPRRRSALERALAHPEEPTDAITRMQADRIIQGWDDKGA